MPNIQKISLLCRKQIKNINPENIGWIRPDGIINFATKDAAKIYAINRCIDANKCLNKFERGIVVKDNMILQEANGKLLSVNINHKKISKYKDCDIYHNHTTPGTLSGPDFGLLKTRKHLKTITAIDILGRCYTMTKLPLNKIKFLPRKLSDFITANLQTIKGILMVERIKSKYNYEIKKMENELVKQSDHLSNEELKNLPVFKTLLEKVLKMCAEIDKMWSENAESLGIKYEHRKI